MDSENSISITQSMNFHNRKFSLLVPCLEACSVYTSFSESWARMALLSHQEGKLTPRFLFFLCPLPPLPGNPVPWQMVLKGLELDEHNFWRGSLSLFSLSLTKQAKEVVPGRNMSRMPWSTWLKTPNFKTINIHLFEAKPEPEKCLIHFPWSP